MQWGLINRVVPPGEALPAALELAEEIAANAPLAVQASKRLALGATAVGRVEETALWQLNSAEMAAILRTEDAHEGPTAFAEKRAPVWKAR
jgi:crotonobetainyl-CoA hydratase